MCNIPHCCLPQESGPCLSPNVAGRPLRPATDRRLGGPLPRQPANQTRAPPMPPELSPAGHAAPWAYAVLAAVSGRCPPAWGRLPTRYSPVRHSVPQGLPINGPAPRASFDLHVLGTPPAFILSQDQTLMFYFPFQKTGFSLSPFSLVTVFRSQLSLLSVLNVLSLNSFKVVPLFGCQCSRFCSLRSFKRSAYT